MEGIGRVEARISEITERMGQLAQLRPMSTSAVGWGPGLSGAGEPFGAATTASSAAASTTGAYSASSTNMLAQSLGLTDSVGTDPYGDPLSSFANQLTRASSLDPEVLGLTVDRAGNIVRPSGTASAIPEFTAPASLAGYGNGQIPLEALEPIGIGKHRLWGPAAMAFRQMALDAQADGVNIGVTDSYRSYDQQVALAGDKGLYSEGGYAATPGTSKHGWGVAIDADVDSRGLAWMRANAANYGFHETTPREPWHWEYRGW